MLSSPTTFLTALAAMTFVVAALCFFAYDISEAKDQVRRRVERFALGGGPLPLADAARSRSAAEQILVTALRGNELEFARRLGPLHIRPKLAARSLWVVRAVSAVLLAAATVLTLYLYAGIHGRALVGLTVIGAVLGWFIPDFVLRRFALHRTREIARGLPDAIELLAVAVEAGLSLEEAMNRIVVELRAAQPVMAEELAVTCADLRVLPDRSDALRRLAQRIDLPSVNSVVTTLSQTLRYGTPLARALRIVASELRNDALLRLEEQANRLPVFLTIPMILFILPSLIMIIAGPAGLKIWDVFIHWR